MALLLREPFADLSSWTNLTVATIAVGGRNGSCLQLATSGQADYRLGAGESDTVTCGFAWQVPTVGAIRSICSLRSDTGATVHLAFQMTATGAIEVRRGGTGGTLLGTTAATGLITAATWAVIEVQAKLHDTTGYVIIRVNGTERLNLTALDTKNAGTKTVFDTVALASSSAITALFDDLYVRNDTTFQGDTPITGELVARQAMRVGVVTPGAAQNYRQSVRAAVRTFGPFLVENFRQAVKVLTPAPTQPAAKVLNYRQSVRVLTSVAALPNEARVARLSARALHTGGTSEARLARLSLRALITVVAGATVKSWTGSAFASAPVKAWNGTAFVDALAVKTWNGTAFV